jgi:hypothetical protein
MTLDEVLMEETIRSLRVSISEFIDDVERYLKQQTLFQLATRCYEKTNDSAIEKAITVAVAGAEGAARLAAAGKFASKISSIAVASNLLLGYQFGVFAWCALTEVEAARAEAEKEQAKEEERRSRAERRQIRFDDFDSIDRNQYEIWEREDREWVDRLA